MTDQKMREAFNALITQGHMVGFDDFRTGWEACEALAQQPNHPEIPESSTEQPAHAGMVELDVLILHGSSIAEGSEPTN